MVNSVGISQGYASTRANGKSHCRKDELAAGSKFSRTA